jgi:hypothetical protein
VRNREGKLIPLESVSKVRASVGPLTVAHMGQVPAVTMTFNLNPDIALSQATAEIERISREILPPTISGTFQGTAAAFTSSLAGLGWTLLIAVLVIYLVLGILYEDFLHPLTILSGLPSATFGALLTLVLFKQELNIYGYVGLIMLIGIVKKNAIMMIDFALDAKRNRHKGAEEAIFEACLVRFRPIMMTTVAALAGTLPIALGWGAGADARRTLGLAVDEPEQARRVKLAPLMIPPPPSGCAHKAPSEGGEGRADVARAREPRTFREIRADHRGWPGSRRADFPAEKCEGEVGQRGTCGSRTTCIGYGGRPAQHPADASLWAHLSRRPIVFRRMRNTAGETPTLPETCRCVFRERNFFPTPHRGAAASFQISCSLASLSGSLCPISSGNQRLVGSRWSRDHVLPADK